MSAGASTAPVDESALRWAPVAGARGFELRAGDSLVGQIRWATRFGSLAEAEVNGREISLKRAGFLAPQVIVRDRATGQELGRLHAHGSHSRVEIVGAGTYELRRASLLVPSWVLRSWDGGPVLNLEPVEEGGRLKGGLVVVEPAFQRAAELPLLLAITWYFIVAAWFEEVAVLAGDAALRAASDP